MDAKSATRLSRMAKYFPDEKVRVIDHVWFKDAARNIAGFIANWESRRDRRQAALIFPA
jgi:glucose-6-phosphate 1-dehydrogenase